LRKRRQEIGWDRGEVWGCILEEVAPGLPKVLIDKTLKLSCKRRIDDCVIIESFQRLAGGHLFKQTRGAPHTKAVTAMESTRIDRQSTRAR
jgi:hypothetical protein